MFGLFKKKPGAEEAGARASEDMRQERPAPAAAPGGPMPSAIELDQRIEQIRQEFAAVLGQAVAASEATVAATQNDFSELERLWRPVDAERDKAQAGMTRSWNACSRAINREHESDEARDYQMNKCDFASLEIEIAYQGAIREVRARAAQAMLNFALHSDARSRSCTACAQPISSILIDRAQNIQCPACGAPQLVEPGMAFRVFAAVGALYVGHYDGMHSWADMERYEMQIQKFRNTKDVPMELLHNYHSAAQNYWSVVFGSEAELVPAMAAHAQSKIDAHMKASRKLLRSHWQWREMEEGQPSV